VSKLPAESIDDLLFVIEASMIADAADAPSAKLIC